MVKRFYYLLLIITYPNIFSFPSEFLLVFPPAIFFFFLLNFRSSQNDNLHQKKITKVRSGATRVIAGSEIAMPQCHKMMRK